MTRVLYQRREAFTQNTINTAISKYPTFNWVICHTSYSVAFDGVEGTDWGHYHHELGISFFRTIGLEFSYLSIFVSIFLITFYTVTIFIGQSQEHSIDMEMVDLSTYVFCFFKLVTQK